ncbi:hypothetical protein [Candidatus Electronema sp. JM]|uniref:hypothetical protein n=1 Tax=Candidatus Electronema sp. JM TaxID=3401571 RepID=UPI003AA89FBF
MSSLRDEYRQHMAAIAPQVGELPGDLAMIAGLIEEISPGQGVRITMMLADRLHGTKVLWHNLRGMYKQQRDAWMRQRYDAGDVTVRDLALVTGLGERQVSRVLGKVDEEGPQLRLF